MGIRTEGSSGVTGHDVALHAGVSIATVSRALSGNRQMSDELKARVLDSAEALGYQVNLVGRALRKKLTSTFGLVIPDLENPFFSSLAQNVSRSFAQSEVDVLIASADNDVGRELRAVQSFLGRQVDGIVLIPHDEKESRTALENASRLVPTIQFDRFVPGSDVPFVGCDNRFGMKLVAEHIAKHRQVFPEKVFFVGGGQSSSSGRERSSAFMEFMPHADFRDGSFGFSWGQEAAKQILSEGYRKGIIACAADVIALGTSSMLISMGRSVPEDFKVIGFDDVGVSFLAHPTLTTVRQPVAEMTSAIGQFISSHASKGIKPLGLFRPALVVRESSPKPVF